MSINEIIESWKRSRAISSCITGVRIFEKREGQYHPFPKFIHPVIREALYTERTEQLYPQQVEAIEAVHEGKDIVVVSPTASGKTLCYNLPVLNTKLEMPSSKAFYLFTLKALSQDQMFELQGFIQRIEKSIATFTYDGDTPQDARQAIRTRGDIVITNPDMLHTGILPHHTKWMNFFQNLKFVVIDELHTYRGVFGAHMTNVLRRLDRICRFYGSRPQFICCSATIANPKELAERLLERDVTLIDKNGAPSSEKIFLFYNPPIVNKELGIKEENLLRRRSAVFVN